MVLEDVTKTKDVNRTEFNRTNSAAGIVTNSDLEKLIVQDPLIETAPSLNGVKDLILPTSTYFGVGLCNGSEHPQLSVGLPIDVLSMILLSELLGQRKYILIADTHAKTNGFSDEDVAETASRQRNILNKLIDNLGLNNWEVMLASDIDASPSYTAIFNSFDEHNLYFKREITDMMWFFREKDVHLKVGWALNGSRNTDEVSFDRKFRDVFGAAMSFIYTVSGKTFNPKKIRASPYFCESPETRILLDSGENVQAKLDYALQIFGKEAVNSVNGYKTLLKGIVRLYDRVIEQTEKMPIEQKVQYVLDRCTR